MVTVVAGAETATHAGAVVVDMASGLPRYLGTSCVLPKGHIENGEAPQAAAVREVCEGAGVLARVLEPLGPVSFERSDGTVRVEYFLVQLEGRPARNGIRCGYRSRTPRLR